MKSTGNLPENWECVKVEKLGILIRGVSYKKEDVITFFKTNHLPVLRANNIQDIINFDDLIYVPEKYIREQQKIKPGDIIFATSSGSKHLVGKSGKVGSGFSGSFGAFCAVFRPHEGLNKDFISYFFKTPYYRSYIKEISKGTNINNLKREHILDIFLRFPPLPEQRRIVAKIEELFSELDKGIESLKIVQQQLKVYRQAVLKWAFEGKLTALWRSLQNGLPSTKELKKSIKIERLEYAKIREKKTTDMSLTREEISVLPELPEEWCWVKLNNIAYEISDGDHQPPPKSQNGVPFITISNVINSKIDFSNTFYVSEEYYGKLKENRKPIKGDVLYTVTGSFGIPVLVDFNHPFCFQRHIGLVRPTRSIKQKWIYYLLQSPGVFSQAKKVATGTAQKTVPLKGLRNFILPLSSSDEQDQIVQEIEARLSICDKIEEIISLSLRQSEALRQSILKMAFEGKLVPQNPSDEPASKLLERIKAEIGNLQSHKKVKERVVAE